LIWHEDAEKWPPLRSLTQTSSGLSYQKKSDDNSISLIVAFEGPVFKKLSEQIQLEGVVSVHDNGKLLDTKAIRNDATVGWRMILRVRCNEDNNKPVELRGFLYF